MEENSVIPTPLRRQLLQVGAALQSSQKLHLDSAAMLLLLGSISPRDLPAAEREIVEAAALLRWKRTPSLFNQLILRQIEDEEQLCLVDGLEWLFIFHRDGRLREAALRRIRGGLPNAFIFAAVAWRLNDWASPVREAAVECANRAFPLTSPEVVAGAAEALLARTSTWGRWGTERKVIDEVYCRPDVSKCLAELVATRTTGPMATLLRLAMRSGAMDDYLLGLSTHAAQPAVRAVAVQSLINGTASWPNNWAWRWIDKSMGIRRRETVFETRPLAVSADCGSVIRRGLEDRAAVVRNVAMSGLIAKEGLVTDARELAANALADRSPAVRDRANFLLRRVAG